MDTLTGYAPKFDHTVTATLGTFVQGVARHARAQLTRPGEDRIAFSNPTSGSTLRQGFDPEEVVLARLRSAEQAKRRADAHARIQAKRQANPVDALLALLELPEYRIEVSDELLQEILESYPEDE